MLYYYIFAIIIKYILLSEGSEKADKFDQFMIGIRHRTQYGNRWTNIELDWKNFKKIFNDNIELINYFEKLPTQLLAYFDNKISTLILKFIYQNELIFEDPINKIQECIKYYQKFLKILANKKKIYTIKEFANDEEKIILAYVYLGSNYIDLGPNSIPIRMHIQAILDTIRVF
jgi:hypothetical protein